MMSTKCNNIEIYTIIDRYKDFGREEKRIHKKRIFVNKNYISRFKSI